MKNFFEITNLDELDESEKLFMFKSSLFCILPAKYNCSFSVIERIKLLMRAIRGYYLFSLEKNGKMIAYCFLKKNYLSKYPFMEKNDLIVNPYFVCEECRGRKLGEKIVKAALNNMPTETENVWAIVLNDNIPSIKTLQRIGFELEGYSHVVNSSHHIQQEPTDKLVFKYHIE